MLTTSPSFEGYRIIKYIDIVFDESITGIGLETAIKRLGDVFSSFTGEQMRSITNRINELKKESIERLKEKVYELGANSIIGIDLESTISNRNAVMVSANGTAVIVEKL